MLKALSSGVRGRRAIGVVALSAGLLTALTACGDATNPKNDPQTNAASAQSVLDDFVTTYNGSGVAQAVEGSFCSDAVAANEGKTSFDGAPYAADSMELASKATVDGTAGEARVDVSSPGQNPRTLTVHLRKDAAQGWCLTGLTPA